MTHRDTIYIGGEWVAPTGHARRDVEDPATGAVVGSVPEAGAGDVDRAVAAARAAFPGWAATPVAERAQALRRLHEELTRRTDALVAAVRAEMGAPEKLAQRVQVGLPLQVLAQTADVAESFGFEEHIGNSLVVREPVGVVAAITPWNYPLHQAMAKVAPALAAGCTVVLKPAELTPLSAYVLANAVADAGLPAGVFNLVPGEGRVVGEALAAHPGVDMVSFTGSTAVGRHIGAVAAATVKRVALELGGKSASVVLDDVDGDLLSTAVKVTLANCFLNTGQTCTAWTRLVVPRGRMADVEALVAEFIGRHRPGDTLGPLVSAAQRDRVLGYIDTGLAEGARLVAGGPGVEGLPEQGYHVAPTVFGDVTTEMRIAREEIFGPVLSILGYDDDADALRIEASTDYGLAGAVWSASNDRAVAFARGMRTGQVDINGGRFNSLAPFGGYKQSGNGREFGVHGLVEFLDVKSLQM
ncbi:aldehyde dehydrogenase family protein [Sphaerisporangium flaviroseum]|uniref:aldehyde dehydrogenase (NAD(+)) n=1 Tax=Sphaerisporangium flaviroseum TaxID=509199 RepID=A0ABP7I9Q8_9ACTN